jgi:hypothetical protein
MRLVLRKEYYGSYSGFDVHFPLSKKRKLTLNKFKLFTIQFLYGSPTATKSSKYQHITGYRSQFQIASKLGLTQEAISIAMKTFNKGYTLIQLTEAEYNFAISRNLNADEDCKFVRVFKFKNEYLALVGTILINNMKYRMLSYNPKTNKTIISYFTGKNKSRIQSTNENHFINSVVSDPENILSILQNLALNHVHQNDTRADLYSRRIYQFKATSLNGAIALYLLKMITQSVIKSLEENSIVRFNQQTMNNISFNKMISWIFFNASKIKHNVFGLLSKFKDITNQVKELFCFLDFKSLKMYELVEIDVKGRN